MKYLWKNFIDMPPVWLLIFILIVWGQSRFWNPYEFAGFGAAVLGWGLIVIGFVLAGWAFRQFKAHKTSIIPRNTPSAMIARGPYRFSRNPIYLADALFLCGFALLMGSVIGLILVVVFIRLIEIRFIKGEEAGLAAEFPDDFAKMRQNTRRWI